MTTGSTRKFCRRPTFASQCLRAKTARLRLNVLCWCTSEAYSSVQRSSDARGDCLIGCSGDSSVQKVWGGANWGQPKLWGGNTKTFDYTSVCCFYGTFVVLHKVQQCLFPSISRRKPVSICL